MRKLLVASSVAFGLASGVAFAADMPMKAHPPAPIAANWTGCYVSAGWGYGMLDDERSITNGPTFPNTTSAAKGYLGAVGGGCDYQFNNSPIGPVVVGAFADYDFMNIKGDYGDPSNINRSGTLKESSAWYVGARAGVLVTPRLLTFIEGGWTGAHIDTINFINSNGTPSGLSLTGQNLNGWFFGGGTEYAFTMLPIKGLYWKTEYRLASYDNIARHYTSNIRPGTRFVNDSVDVQTITTSLVWRFNQ